MCVCLLIDNFWMIFDVSLIVIYVRWILFYWNTNTIRVFEDRCSKTFQTVSSNVLVMTVVVAVCCILRCLFVIVSLHFIMHDYYMHACVVCVCVYAFSLTLLYFLLFLIHTLSLFVLFKLSSISPD